MSKRSVPMRSSRANGGMEVAAGRRPVPRTATPKPLHSRQTRRSTAARARKRLLLLSIGVPLLAALAIVGVLLSSRTTSSSAGGLANASALNPGSTLLSAGTVAPNFTLATVDGKRYQLSALRGKPVLLEFFAVWCPYCQAESSILNQVDKNYGPKGLQTVAVLASPYGKNYDNSGGADLSIVTKSDVSWFIQDFGVKHPTLIDPSFATVNAYNASSYPTIYTIDKNGIIRYANSGAQTYAQLSAGIAAAS
jgi:cytochrome c biogenesis protein CcmG/thiol:disulfide interchange protein DsbE